MQLIDLQSQLHRLQPAINERINTVLSHGQFILGPEVSELEAELAGYVGTEHCITCANGTDALQIALMALDIGPGDIVFTTAFSFFATAEVIALVGATPYFVDIDKHTFNLCPESLASAIAAARQAGLKPKAVIAVDLFGLPADYPAISAICKQHNLKLIEDGAQGFGGTIAGHKACSFGDIATTSFFPAKPLGCFGDGGAIFTANATLAERCQSIRVHGKGSHKYENVRIGLNSRLDTLQAAILLEKLSIFDQECISRQRNAAFLSEHLISSIVTPHIPHTYSSAWAQYSIWHPEVPRETFLTHLSESNIPHAIYYPIPLNQQTALSQVPSVATPNSIAMSQRIFSIPTHAYLTAAELDLIVETLNGCLT
ncbi:DegT/DnrJ/EryC1/StrS family aminotransferase [Alteromonas flava]|uniref:DegT/DnrJ/EryC1/StrS family aminotransferase n=1 Tax=Alteromonas flava TaxID=2048003 RepID=UPI000C2812EA|nr:DegT/DnrJ/EryC1/StrS family aminotransferase [Alteromonas flava]